MPHPSLHIYFSRIVHRIISGSCFRNSGSLRFHLLCVDWDDLVFSSPQPNILHDMDEAIFDELGFKAEEMKSFLMKVEDGPTDNKKKASHTEAMTFAQYAAPSSKWFSTSDRSYLPTPRPPFTGGVSAYPARSPNPARSALAVSFPTG